MPHPVSTVQRHCALLHPRFNLGAFENHRISFNSTVNPSSGSPSFDRKLPIQNMYEDYRSGPRDDRGYGRRSPPRHVDSRDGDYRRSRKGKTRSSARATGPLPVARACCC